MHVNVLISIDYTVNTNALFVSLQNLYESIKSEPFKIPEDDGNDLTHTFFNPDREGWLLKLGLNLTTSSSASRRLIHLSAKPKLI